MKPMKLLKMMIMISSELVLDIIISCTGFYKVKIVCHSIDYGILPIVIIVIMNKVLNGHGTHLPNLT